MSGLEDYPWYVSFSGEATADAHAVASRWLDFVLHRGLPLPPPGLRPEDRGFAQWLASLPELVGLEGMREILSSNQNLGRMAALEAYQQSDVLALWTEQLGYDTVQMLIRSAETFGYSMTSDPMVCSSRVAPVPYTKNGITVSYDQRIDWDRYGTGLAFGFGFMVASRDTGEMVIQGYGDKVYPQTRNISIALYTQDYRFLDAVEALGFSDLVDIWRKMARHTIHDGMHVGESLFNFQVLRGDAHREHYYGILSHPMQGEVLELYNEVVRDLLDVVPGSTIRGANVERIANATWTALYEDLLVLCPMLSENTASVVRHYWNRCDEFIVAMLTQRHVLVEKLGRDAAAEILEKSDELMLYPRLLMMYTLVQSFELEDKRLAGMGHNAEAVAEMVDNAQKHYWSHMHGLAEDGMRFPTKSGDGLTTHQIAVRLADALGISKKPCVSALTEADVFAISCDTGGMIHELGEMATNIAGRQFEGYSRKA